MHKHLSILLFTAWLFSGCTKKDELLKYTLAGLSDISISNPGQTSIPIEVGYQSGEQENVTLSVKGLPATVTASFVPATGIPPFTAMLNLDCKETMGGAHAISITGSTAAGNITSGDGRLTIKPHCTETISGSYNARRCDNGAAYTITIAPHPDSFGSILIKGIPEFGDMPVRAKVRCTEKRIEAVKQVSGNGAVMGGFGYANGAVALAYYTDGPNAIFCDLGILERQK